MSEKACSNCHFLTKESSSLSEDYGGLVVLYDPESSAIAKAMDAKDKGRYALKVR